MKSDQDISSSLGPRLNSGYSISGDVSEVPLRKRNRTYSSSVGGKGVLRLPEEELVGLEKSSNDMREPWRGRNWNCWFRNQRFSLEMFEE